MNNSKNNITISKLNLNLVDFSQKKFNINLNRVAFIFIVIFFSDNFIFNKSDLFIFKNLAK